MATSGRAEEVGDPYGVVARWEEVYRDGPYLGRNLVRLHEEAFAVFYTPEGEGSRFYLDLPLAPQGAGDPLCALTDRPPEDLARKARGSLLGQVLTLKEVFVPLNQRHGLVERPLPPDRVPERAYVACLYGAEAPRLEALGPLVLDLYPARLVRREPQSVEVLRAEAGPTELVFQVRLHPLPLGDVPLDLYTLDPPRLPGGERVVAFPYHGFDRDPTQPRYALSLHEGPGGFFLWILQPEVHTFTLFARLTLCQKAEGKALSPSTLPPGPRARAFPWSRPLTPTGGSSGPGRPSPCASSSAPPRGGARSPLSSPFPRLFFGAFLNQALTDRMVQQRQRRCRYEERVVASGGRRFARGLRP